MINKRILPFSLIEKNKVVEYHHDIGEKFTYDPKTEKGEASFQHDISKPETHTMTSGEKKSKLYKYDPKKQEMKISELGGTHKPTKKKGSQKTIPTTAEHEKELKEASMNTYSIDELTVARLFKDKSAEETEEVLKAIEDIDKFITQAQHKYERRKPAREAYQKKTKEALEATKRAEQHFRSKAEEGFGETESSEKSIDSICDNIMKKAISSLYTTPGALASKTSGGAAGVSVMKEIDKKTKGKKMPEVKVTKQYPATSPKTHPEAYGMGGAEKSYSLDFNKSILERMGLEKGRKAAWELKEPIKGEEEETAVPGHLMGDPGSRIHERKRIGEIHEEGAKRSRERMATSKDPADISYARKKGWI
jgi:hypothetical protein